MRLDPRSSVWLLALVPTGYGLRADVSAQTPGPALAAPHPTSIHPGIIRFGQAGGLPYGPTVGVSPAAPSGMGGPLTPVATPYSLGTGGVTFGNNPGRPLFNRRMIFNPPIANPALLALRFAPNTPPNGVAFNAAFNPGTLNPVVVLPAPGAILSPEAAAVQLAAFGPRVNPWAPLGPAVVFAAPGTSSSSSERSPGAESSAPEVYYDPSTRTFVSPPPGGLTRPSATGFLPWIWE